MTLTAMQIEERRSSIGGSDARTILSGEWGKLWDNKCLGIDEEFDSQTRFLMALGTACEPVIRNRWISENNHLIHLEYSNQRRVSSSLPYLTANLDSAYVLEEGKTELIQEIKYHTGMKTMDELVEYYYGQLQHNMYVSGVDKIEFTVGFGAWGKYHTTQVDIDHKFLKDYILKCEAFWWHVENKERPEDQEATKFVYNPDKARTIFMSDNNRWASMAYDWKSSQEQAKIFKDVTKEIKEYLEPDAGVTFGAGIKAKRSKNGAVTITECSLKERDKYLAEDHEVNGEERDKANAG